MPSSPVENPTDSRGALVTACIWVLLLVAGIFLGLRIYCKCIRRRGLWWDDHFLIVSWFLLLVSAICSTVTSTLGFGRHVAQVPNQNWTTLNILSLCAGSFSILSSVTSKTSFALTLLRLSDGWLKILIWIIIVAMNLLMPFSVPLLWVSCNPSGELWGSHHQRTCWDPAIFILYSTIVGAFSAACDFTLALLPWKILLRFHMYRREKIGVGIAMSMGIFAGATAIIKCVKMHLLGSADFTYDGIPFIIWGFAECAITIMAASIPVLRALFNEVRAHHAAPRVPALRPVVSSTARSGSKNNDTTVYPSNPHRSDDRSEKSLLDRSGVVLSGQPPDDADVLELHSRSRTGQAAASDAVEL